LRAPIDAFQQIFTFLVSVQTKPILPCENGKKETGK
jgi:hypothetical protein